MNGKLIGAVGSAAALLAAHPEPADATTYLVGWGVNTILVTGTITTDGDTGTLSAADITDWNIVLFDGNTVDLEGPLSGNNSHLAFLGSDLSATSTGLFFNFDDPGSSQVLFESDANPSVFGPNGITSTLDARVLFLDFQTLNFAGDGEVEIAFASAPEPPSWGLMLAGFAGLAAALRKRRARSAAT